jgi:ABC-type transporter Mla MlaB component
VPGLGFCLFLRDERNAFSGAPGADNVHSLPLHTDFVHTLRTVRKRVELEAWLLNEVESTKKTLQSLAHDLRTPTTAIMSSAELLADDAPAALSGDLQNIVENASTIEDLASRIIALTREGDNTLALRPKKLQAAPFLQKCCDIVKGVAMQKKIRIEKEVPPGLPELWIDPVAGQRIICNILDNAITTTSAGGTIRIEMIQAGEFLRCSITDEGPGFTLEQLNQLFIRPVTPASGTHGLGLAITWELVSLHGGVIWADNAQPRGAVFCFTLPTIEHRFTLFHGKSGDICAAPLPEGIVVHFKGRLENQALGTLRNSLFAATEEAQVILLDFKECTGISSGILALFVELFLENSRKGRTIQIQNESREIRKLLEEVQLRPHGKDNIEKKEFA